MISILLPSRAAAEIHKLAHAFDALDKGLDRLWPTLPLEVMKRVEAVRELEQIGTLAQRLHNIADDVEDAAAENDA